MADLKFKTRWKTNKGTFLGATRGFSSSMVEIVGGHEYVKKRREFRADGQLCALPPY
jgi:hypothetical protein